MGGVLVANSGRAWAQLRSRERLPGTTRSCCALVCRRDGKYVTDCELRPASGVPTMIRPQEMIFQRPWPALAVAVVFITPVLGGVNRHRAGTARVRSGKH